MCTQGSYKLTFFQFDTKNIVAELSNLGHEIKNIINAHITGKQKNLYTFFCRPWNQTKKNNEGAYKIKILQNKVV